MQVIAAILSGIVALAKAIPVVEALVSRIEKAWFELRIAKMKKENLDALRKIISEHDQRDLEKVLGSPTAGKPSGDAGSVIVDPDTIGLPKA